jgi:hypothetical protein
MEQWLNSVLSRIAEGSLLPTRYFANLDCDAALDARDSDDDFDSAWCKVSEDVKRRCKEVGMSAWVKSLIERIRQESFLAVSRATKQHEIASYVSDDFELMAMGRLAGLNEPLLNQLWLVYDRGEFPYPPV